MILSDPEHQRLRIVPVTVIVIGLALLAALILSLAGVVDLRRIGQTDTTHLILAGGILFSLVVAVWQWRTVMRRGNEIRVVSLVSRQRFSVSGVNVFVVHQRTSHGHGLGRRKQDVWRVGLEQGEQKVYLCGAGSSSGGQGLAAKIRNALGLGLHDHWG